MNDLMLDLETLGNKSNSALLSIGAVEFNRYTGEYGREFYKIIDLQSSLDAGLTINGSTFYWWLQQSQSARDEICKEGEHIMTVLSKFNEFIKSLNRDILIWGNGARFDIGILEDAYVRCGYNKMPWNFRNERDVRTILDLAPHIKNSIPVISIEHHPIHDCKFQIQYVSKILSNLKINI